MDLTARIQTYWNKRSKGYSKVRQIELDSPDGRAWQEYMLAQLPLRKGLRILDVGTGPGFLAILMALAGHQVTALDSASEMLAEARQNAEAQGVSIREITGNAQSLPFPDASFDGIVTRNLTWTLPDVAAAYRDWYRVLAPGGVLLNFDSDYGSAQFAEAANARDNIHHELASSLLQECQAIKDTMAISRQKRPEWDLHQLKMIGFRKISCDSDIRERVHRSKRMRYDDRPLFCLRALK
jgi:ubiquinone/menaquinone biosynthesis C-methylase UbiE